MLLWPLVNPEPVPGALGKPTKWQIFFWLTKYQFLSNYIACQFLLFCNFRNHFLERRGQFGTGSRFPGGTQNMANRRITFDQAIWVSNFSVFKIKLIHDRQFISWTDVATLGPVLGTPEESGTWPNEE